MINYPTRTRFTPSEYRDRCVGGEVWQLLDSVFKGQRALLFPPGGLAFGTVGFLGNFPGVALVLFLQLTVFQGESVDFQGYFAVFGIVAVVLSHSLIMLRAILGQTYAQQDLVFYLQLMLAACCGFTAFALVSGAQFGSTLLPITATVLSAFLLRLSRSMSFTLFAEIMRVKRIYLKERDEERRARIKQKSGSR